MRRKSLWLLVSAVIIIAMLLTACSKTPETTTAVTTTATTTTATTTTATTKTSSTTPTTTAATAEMPKYGGTMTVALASETLSYDSWSTNPHAFARMIYDSLMLGNIQVTEDQWPCYGMYFPKQYVVSCVIESWEETAIDTTVLHVRQGIHFQNLPPVNGRELTAEDVVYTYERDMSPQSQISSSQNLRLFCKSIEVVDPYTVEYKYKPEQVNLAGGWWTNFYKSNTWPVAKEVVDKYNGSLANPIGQVGTGPFIIKDYVPGSSFTCVRNPDYWGTDPRYPGNKLPYIDKVITTVIPDLSTRLAALRTGKVARLSSIDIEQQASLVQTNPELKYRKLLTEGSTYISMRTDILPFDDIKVRQALSMSIDRQAIVDQYFNGDASYSNYGSASHWLEYIPLSEFPEETQQIFEYHPDKARELLAAAGYPDGFKTEVNVSAANSKGIDMMQLIKVWWLDIGVDADIKVLESAAVSSLQSKHTYSQMTFAGGGWSYTYAWFSYHYQPDATFRVYNSSCVVDPVYNQKYEALMAAYDKPQAQIDALYRDLYFYARQQCNILDLPSVNTYVFWQPWLKGHWGQAALTFGSSGDFYKYMWIDKD